jgi:plasmid stabilization system protein ParE
MDTISDNDEMQIKPAITTLECEDMLNEALAYSAKNYSLKQAEIMHNKFYSVLEQLENMPGIGTKLKNGMRKFPLGKYPYYIYYRENEDYISIRGIWHTSRGTEFSELETQLPY